MKHNLASSLTTGLETLEQRRLLSAAVAGDALVVIGTEQADQLTINYDAATDELVVDLNGDESRHAAADLAMMRLLMGAGDDHVQVDASVALSAWIYGGEGNDYLQGGIGDDRVFAGEGDDTLVGQDGQDLLRGGGGNDQLNGGAGNDQLWGHGGDDVIHGSEGDDLIRGGADADVLKGEHGNDTMLGHDGDDEILGHDGDDLIRGHAGMDRAWAGRGADAVDGGEDDDELDAGSDDENDVLLGQGGNDTFVGFTKADIFADFDRFSDWRAALIADARDGGVQRFRDESGAGMFSEDHPAYEELLAAFDRDGRDVLALVDEHAQDHPGGKPNA
jgi:Ca2+-binding RTX toxin-like protein